MDKIAVLIPCYNEEKTIEKVVTDVKAALPEAVVYVYNNNSKETSKFTFAFILCFIVSIASKQLSKE